jgi:broad specificity phosphatase PhoE
MKTVLYLIHHGATEGSLARPPLLEGRKQTRPLSPLGIRQAEATRDFLAIRPLEHCYSSPLPPAVQTATVVAAPHGLSPVVLERLSECDVGRWEGLDWPTIRSRDSEVYRHFMEDPAHHAYPDGESLADVYRRVHGALEEVLARHAGEAVLVVGHQIVNRTYLAGVLGLSPDHAWQVTLQDCGISVVVRDEEKTSVTTLNAAFHLQGVAA